MNQRGIAQIVVVLIILAGLALGVYLIGQKTFFKPKAGLEGTRIEFAGASVSGDKTTSRNVKLKAYYIPPTVSAPVYGPYPTPSYQTPSSVSAPVGTYSTPSSVQGATTGSYYPTPPGGGTYPTQFRVAPDTAGLSSASEYEFRGNPTEIDWVLTAGNGTKTVYAEFKLNGVWGNRVSASITLAEPTVSEPVPTPSPTTPQSARRVFITSTSYNGNLGGLVGADAKCQARANAVNLGGTWKAWLSDATGSPSTRFTKENLPYKNLNGEIIANSWNDLADASIQKSIAWTELKTVHAGWVWTNTNGFGMSNSLDNCSNWTAATSPYKSWIGYGNVIPPGSRWTIDSKLDCWNQARLYCFEQLAAVSPTPQPVACSACAADVNRDGKVTILDFSKLSSCLNKKATDLSGGTSCANADINGDGVVTILDYNCLSSKFNQRCEANLTTQPRVSARVVSNNPPTVTSSVYKGFYTRIVISARDVDGDDINVAVLSKPSNSFGPYCFGSKGVRTCYIYTRGSGTMTATASDGKGGTSTTTINVSK